MSSVVQSFVAPYVPLVVSRKIKYYPTMRFSNGHECDADDFEDISRINGSYEFIPDDVPVKIYLDADHKFDDCDEFDLINAKNVLRIHKLYLSAYLFEKTGVKPIFAASEAHCVKKIGDDGKEYSKYSLHISTQNILMFKEDMGQMIPEINEYVAKDQSGQYSAVTDNDKYTDYMNAPGPAFDINPYHKTHQLIRGINASKPGENRPFKLIEGEGSFNDNVITAFFAPDAVVYTPPRTVFVPTELSAAVSDTERLINKAFIEKCLAHGMFVKFAREFKTWSDMGLFLKGYFGDTTDGYALFDEFSKLAGPGQYTPENNRDLWDKFGSNPEKYANFGIFINWAKKDNLAEYKEIKSEIDILKKNAKAAAKINKKPKLSDANAETLGRYHQYLEFDITTDVGAMQYLTAAEPNKFMWIRDKGAKAGDIYSWTGNRWEIGTLEFERYISTTGLKMLEDVKTRVLAELKEDDDVSKMLLNSIKAGIHNFQNRTNQLKIIASSEAFYTRDVEFDAKNDIIGFNNGVYDLIKHEFRPTEYDDYITMSCGYDYNPNVDPEKTAEIHNLLNTIMPNPEHKQLLLEVMSNGLTGRVVEKFVMFNGGGRNGKGLLNEFLKTLFGDYQLIYANVSLLTEKTTTGANPELASIHRKRIVVMKEPDAGEKLNNGVVNAITGGGNVSGRMLFSNKTIISLCLILIMECNKRPKFKADPVDADAERLIDLLFPNRFTTDEEDIDGLSVFRANAEYKTDEWKLAHRDAFMQILIGVFKDFQGRGYKFTIPHEVKARGREHLNASLPLYEMMSNLYTKTGERTDVVKLQDAYEYIKASEEWAELPFAKKRDYKYKYFCEFIQNNSAYRRAYNDRLKMGSEQYKSVLIGYRLTSEIDL